MHTALRVHFDFDVLLQMFVCYYCQFFSKFHCLWNFWSLRDVAGLGHLLSSIQKTVTHSSEGKYIALRQKSGRTEK